MKKILLLSAAFLALQAVPALAQDGVKPHHGGKGPERMFEMQDANKDGKISEAEFVEFSKKRFVEMDANKDGSVTKEEAKTHFDKKKAEWAEKRKEMKAKKEAEGKPADAPKE